MAQSNEAPKGVTTLDRLGESKAKADAAAPEGFVRLINPVHAHLDPEKVGRIGQTLVPESLVDELLASGFVRA